MENINLISKSLSNLHTGEKGIVTSLKGGKDFRNKMLALGLVPGKEFEILKGNKNGPFVLKIDETRLMLGCGMAEKIMIK
ncbi:MAG: ferrous iron transport protein A [Halanaerobiales bacterium]|nr:ferrous iron transport protein A [Halanaerobiales bacterium]